MPTVSVIIPTYNRAAMLKEAIESVLAQTYQDWELIVVDDGSTDETPCLMDTYREADARIRCLKQHNQGLSSARNAGLRIAQGEFVAFLDDDDLWLPEKLRLQTMCMQEHPEFGLTYTRFYLLGGKQERLLLPRKPGTTFLQLVEANFIPVLTVMVRRTCLEEVGLFNERFRATQDYELWLRILRRHPIHFIDKPLACYRKHGSNMTAKLIPMLLEHIEVLKMVQPDRRLGVTAFLKRKVIAIYHYKIARLFIEERDCRQASQHFFNALRFYPAIGQTMRWDGQRGVRLAFRWLNPYVAAPYYFLKGLTHVHR